MKHLKQQAYQDDMKKRAAMKIDVDFFWNTTLNTAQVLGPRFVYSFLNPIPHTV